jgi:hypothetical protein
LGVFRQLMTLDSIRRILPAECLIAARSSESDMPSFWARVRVMRDLLLSTKAEL